MEIDDVPTFRLKNEHFEKVATINNLLISAASFKDKKTEIRLRRESNVRSINSSLAIEGNTLGFPKVRALVSGRGVEGDFDQILEVQNAIKAYQESKDADPWSIDCLLSIHDTMTFGLVEEPGFRRCPVGVFEGERMIYKAPDFAEVPGLVRELLDWGSSSELPAPIIAAVVHYYLEAIHPFSDGNGRMGRLWHTMILCRSNSIFELVPLESKIHSRQGEYYDVLERCQNEGSHDCTEFISFCLDLAISSLTDLLHLTDERMMRLLAAMTDDPMSLAEIMAGMKLKDRVSFTKLYLRPAMDYGFVAMTDPGNPTSPTQRYRKILYRGGLHSRSSGICDGTIISSPETETWVGRSSGRDASGCPDSGIPADLRRSFH